MSLAVFAARASMPRSSCVSSALFIAMPASAAAKPQRRAVIQGCLTAIEPVRNRPHDLARRLVLSLPLIRHLPQQVVFGPSQIGHFHDHLGPHPMHARQLERRAEAAVRGGGSASGIFGTCSGFSTPARRLSSLSVMPVPARPA